jgi:hypothetical protein
VILRGKPGWIILDRRISGVKEHKQVQRNGCGNAQHLERERLIAKPGFNRWLMPPAALALHIGMCRKSFRLCNRDKDVKYISVANNVISLNCNIWFLDK